MKHAKVGRTLQEMAADAARGSDGTISCPKCGCRDFRVYKTERGNEATFRYKACRHCGTKVLTTSKVVERIIHEVVTKEDDQDDHGDGIILMAI
jgi:transcriptional regulator NrdR family protein